jgi:hypothetical protein
MAKELAPHISLAWGLRSPLVRFGTDEVSLQRSEVRKAGLKIRIQQQPLKPLEILLGRPEEVVTNEELRS